MEGILVKARDAKRESKSVEFKEQFDVTSSAEWIELIKDFVAIANSGGGVIVIGLQNNGDASNFNAVEVLKLDGAVIADKLQRYIGENFDGFEVHEVVRGSTRVAAITIAGKSDAPIVFRRPGTYVVSGSKQKTVFSVGVAYFRHASKSEPGTADDHRSFIERRLEVVRNEWLGGIRKVVTTTGAIEVVQVKEADEKGVPVKIRLTDDPTAQVYGRLSTDETHPYRQKELIAEFKNRTGITQISPHDVQVVRQVYEIDKNPDYCKKPRYSTKQYSEEFLEWLIAQWEKDSDFFKKARATASNRAKQ